MPEPHITVLLSAEDIATRVRTLARAIDADVPAGGRLHMIGILTGAFVFMADLIRAMKADVTMDFMAVSSYGQGAQSSGEVRVLKDLDVGLEGRDVLIVEDIVDTGLTLSYLQTLLRTRDPRSLRTACLLSKPSRRLVEAPIDYVGFEIEDRFVVGYGLDHSHRYRNLPYVGTVDSRDPLDADGTT